MSAKPTELTGEKKRRIRVIRKRTKPKNIEDLSVIEICRKYPPATWEEVFKQADDELELVSSILDNEDEYYPLKCNLFRAFELCPRHKVRVIIFGQDPYHQIQYNGEPRAQGLSFSVSENDTIPSSLNNIFKEILSDVNVSNINGDLTPWAQQGVLLLNVCLTVRPQEAGSHKKIWLGFIDKVLKDIAQVNPNCIYVLWGVWAKSIRFMIEGNPSILEATHPSGFSANKGFYGCKHFSKINEILLELGKEEINWQT